MSIRLMTLIWELPMSSTQKLVLLALGDWANDEGLCYPSVPSIARRATLSPRQAKRVMHELIGQKWVDVIGNHNGGAASRRYQINTQRLRTGVAGVIGDGLTPPTSDASSRTGVATASVTGVTGDNLSPVPKIGEAVTPAVATSDPRVTRTTNTEPSLDPPQEPPASLVFPPALSGRERVVVVDLLKDLTPEMSQAVLDELAAKLEGPTVSVRSPMQYLNRLIDRAKVGTFVPTAGLSVAARRDAAAARAIEAKEARAQQARLAEARKDPAKQAQIRAQIEEVAQLLGRRRKHG